MDILVGDIMTCRVFCVEPQSSVLIAVQEMERSDIGFLPVVSAGKLWGVLTDRDILLRCIAAGKNPQKIKVSEICSQNITQVFPQTAVRDAAELMAAEQVRRLPVTENGMLKGVLGIKNFFEYNISPEILYSFQDIWNS